MASNDPKEPEEATKFYALIDYEDPYVQPLIISALSKRLPSSSFKPLDSIADLPSPSNPVFQFRQYESIDFDHIMSHNTSLCNAYIIRKALIRKHYLSTTVSNWIVKHPGSPLAKHVKPSVDFELDYAEFLDDALVEAWELKESWARDEGKEEKERAWWILKPGMSERGQGIRLFSSEEELTAIFEEWEEESEEEEDEEDARSDAEDEEKPATESDEKKEKHYIITSHLRHFIAQPYIHPPLLLPFGSSSSELKKFHIRTYILAVGALQVYVYRPMLALFAAKPYIPPWESVNSADGLRAHLTNTCLQETGEREGSVGLFWDLPDTLPSSSNASFTSTDGTSWKEAVYTQIKSITSSLFEAAARGMTIHFQPLPNAFELFGVDFMVGVDEKTGEPTTYLLEVNAFPDFKQTGEELKGLVEGLFEGVVDVAVKPFFGLGGEENGTERMERVLDIDLGRR